MLRLGEDGESKWKRNAFVHGAERENFSYEYIIKTITPKHLQNPCYFLRAYVAIKDKLWNPFHGSIRSKLDANFEAEKKYEKLFI